MAFASYAHSRGIIMGRRRYYCVNKASLEFILTAWMPPLTARPPLSCWQTDNPAVVDANCRAAEALHPRDKKTKPQTRACAERELQPWQGCVSRFAARSHHRRANSFTRGDGAPPYRRERFRHDYEFMTSIKSRRSSPDDERKSGPPREIEVPSNTWTSRAPGICTR